MGEEPNKDVNAGAENEPVGTEKKPTTFDDFLKGEGNQAEFDRRVQKAIETAKTKWQEINDAEKSEAEKLAKMNKEQKLEYEAQKEKKEKEKALAELNAYKLKEQAIGMASEKGLEVSLLDLIDFKTVTAEKLSENIDNMTAVFNKAVEKAVNDKLKEDTPITKTGTDVSQAPEIPLMF
jgi:hypothetical protein